MEVQGEYDKYYAIFGKKTEALYHAIKEAILSGMVDSGARLPSSRELAGRLRLSRGVVNQVYDMLYADGYVSAAAGSGTFAAYRPKTSENSEESGDENTQERAQPARLALSDWAKRLGPVYEPSDRAGDTGGDEASVIDFRLASLDPKLFPSEEWKKVMYAEIREGVHTDVREPLEGHLPLREAIALELWRGRGIRAEARQIVLTNGSMEALALLAMLLITPDDPVVVENPTYPGIVRAVKTAGGRLLNAAVDDAGIVPDEWDSRLLFVTPTRHFPTGAVLSIERRKALLAWASRQGAVIIEDDYDSTFRWGGRPVEPLKALDRDGRVVYVGTFSRTMLGEQRIGYVLLPEGLIEPFRRAKSLLHPTSTGLISQRGLAAFMASGGYERHLRRIRRISGRRLLVLRKVLQSRLGRWFRMVATDAGLHICAYWLGKPEDFYKLLEACKRKGVIWSDGARYWQLDDRAGEWNAQVQSEMIAGRESNTSGEAKGEVSGDMKFEAHGQSKHEARSEVPLMGLFAFAHLEEEQIAIGIARIEAIALALFGEA